MKKSNIAMQSRSQALAKNGLSKFIGKLNTQMDHPRLQAAAPMNLVKIIGDF
ncbi:MAG: hypothetical protein AB2989_05360 [Candidatus Symbiodolus clandestinus]